MLNVKEKGILIIIIKHCNTINAKMSNLTKEQFDKDEDIIQIIYFNIMQIGELAKNIDAEFIVKYNKVPWKQIKGMRDKVAHGYGTIDIDKVWFTALDDINPLLSYCQQIINENKY